jgi:NAD+ synthase
MKGDDMINIDINTNLAKTIISGFIKNEITKAGFTKGLLGLSGGIDSSLSCYLSVEALGPENVIAIRMPYETSSQTSWDHAGLVIEELKIKHLDIPITEMVNPLIDRFPDMSHVRKGNIMARARMIILYDQSKANDALVVGTGNKTEILLGYSTLYGDSACALNPIGDLYKTQVRQLARDLGVPQVIIDKAPSADLWKGQTDEGELGFTYAKVDQLLYLLVDQRYSLDDLLDQGFEKDFILQVSDRIRRFQFKRMPSPIAKLSNRTVGYDFLYMRDWGM